MKDFTVVRKGFDTTEVDTYIVSLESEIEKRDKKLEEYRSKEDAINRAVVDAQLIADAIITKAKEDAQTLKDTAASELESLRKQGLELRRNIVEFQESYNRILRRYLYAAHCEDMHQLFNRLDEQLKAMGEADLPQQPVMQAQPPEEAASAFSQSAGEESAAMSLDEIGAIVRPIDTTKGM